MQYYEAQSTVCQSNFSILIFQSRVFLTAASRLKPAIAYQSKEKWSSAIVTGVDASRPVEPNVREATQTSMARSASTRVAAPVLTSFNYNVLTLA